jgi:hypothetical protein
MGDSRQYSVVQRFARCFCEGCSRYVPSQVLEWLQGAMTIIDNGKRARAHTHTHTPAHVRLHARTRTGTRSCAHTRTDTHGRLSLR